MKKILILLLAVMLIFAAVGCKEKADVTDDTPGTNDTGDAGSVPPPGDSVEEAALAYFAELEGNNIVPWADLFTLIDNGEEPFILSIRQADVYNEGHVEGAYLASWGADLASKIDMLPTDETVYVYCYSGQTAGQAIAIMRMLGIDAVSLRLGYNFGFVKEEGYEAYVSTEPNELPDAGADFNPDLLAFAEGYFNSVDANANFQISPADADMMLKAGDAELIDIRSAADFEAAHIDGAVSIPFGKGMDFSGLSKDEKYIVTCYTGQTAGQAVAIMKALGYDAVSLQFGMIGARGWTNYVKTTAANNYFADYPGSRIVNWEDLFAKIDAGEEPFILSIRSADDYAAGHIKGAYLAAWGTDLAEKVAMLPTDQTVYVYCYSGQTAGQAIALMNMLGIEAVSLKSGFNYGAMTIDGYEAYVSTEAAELPDAGAEFEPFLLGAVKDYFNAIPEGGNNIITLEDAKTAVTEGTASVVDVRSADDFALGHVAGAVNLPFGENMQQGFADLPAGKLIVTCYSGQTAGQVTAVLRMLGYDAVSMRFGMKLGWIAEEYPVVTD